MYKACIYCMVGSSSVCRSVDFAVFQWFQPEPVHFLQQNFSGQGLECKRVVFRGDYPIRTCPTKMEFAEHLPHACLEQEYNFAYAEKKFVPPSMAIYKRFSLLMSML